MKPPYANGARIVAGQLWIRYGQPGWNFLQAHRECGELVCPENRDPAQFEWGAKGLQVYIVADLAGPTEHLTSLIDALKAQGASAVHVNYRLNSWWPHGGDTVLITHDGNHVGRG